MDTSGEPEESPVAARRPVLGQAMSQSRRDQAIRSGSGRSVRVIELELMSQAGQRLAVTLGDRNQYMGAPDGSRMNSCQILNLSSYALLNRRAWGLMFSSTASRYSAIVTAWLGPVCGFEDCAGRRVELGGIGEAPLLFQHEAEVVLQDRHFVVLGSEGRGLDVQRAVRALRLRGLAAGLVQRAGRPGRHDPWPARPGHPTYAPRPHAPEPVARHRAGSPPARAPASSQRRKPAASRRSSSSSIDCRTATSSPRAGPAGSSTSARKLRRQARHSSGVESVPDTGAPPRRR